MRKQLHIAGPQNRNRTVALMGQGTGGGSSGDAPIITGISVIESSGEYTLSYTYADTEGDLESEPLPNAFNIEVSGVYGTGETVTGSYDYEQDNGAAEGATVEQFELADDAGFTTGLVVESGGSYLIDIADADKYIRYGVKPVTASGTEGVFSYTEGQQIQELVEKKAIVLMRRTDSAAYTPDQTYNELISNNPIAGTITGSLNSTTNEALTGLTFELVSTFSNGNNLGPNGAGRYPANAIDNMFNASSGTTRTIRFNVPVGLQGLPYKLAILGGCTNGTVNPLSYTHNSINRTLANALNNVSNVLEWAYTDTPLSGSTISITHIFTSGNAPLNAIEITFKVPV